MATSAAFTVIPLRDSLVIPLTGLDMFASDIETCKHVSASLGSIVIPAYLSSLDGDERESPFISLACTRMRNSSAAY